MKGFIASLFDFHFTTFIAPKIVRIFYKIAIVLIGLGSLGFGFVGFSSGFFAGIGTLLIAPLFFVLYATMVRIGFETTMAQFQVLERVNQIASMLGGGGAPTPVAGPKVPESSYTAPSSAATWGSSASQSAPSGPAGSTSTANTWGSSAPTPASSSTPSNSWGSDSSTAGPSGSGGGWGGPSVQGPPPSSSSEASTAPQTSTPATPSSSVVGRTQIVSPSSLEGWQGNSQPDSNPAPGPSTNGWSAPNNTNNGSNSGWNS